MDRGFRCIVATERDYMRLRSGLFSASQAISIASIGVWFDEGFRLVRAIEDSVVDSMECQ